MKALFVLGWVMLIVGCMTFGIILLPIWAIGYLASYYWRTH